jgi:hypothetical protein
MVDVTYTHGREANEPLAVMKMETLVTERASFFLSEVDQGNIKVDAATLKKGLKVKTTSSISLRRTLKGYGAEHVDSLTAAVPHAGASTEWTLWFTPKKWHVRDVSVAISQVLLHRPNLNNQLSLDSLLSMEVGDLEAYGYDVSRILVAQKEEFRVAEDQRRRDEELRQKMEPEGVRPLFTGAIHSPFGTGNSFANELSLVQSLDTAIAASRAFNGSNLFSAASSEQVRESTNNTYCDIRPGKDLILASPSAKNEKTLPLFLPRPLVAKSPTFPIDHSHSASQLSGILGTCADALGISMECLYLFFEETGVTVAFNRNGSLFFNLRAWEEMGHGRKGREEMGQVGRFWFVVFCHEVAHNLVRGHGAEHGFWT